MFVYFPSVIISVDTSEDCHLQFCSLGIGVSLKDVEYGQPRAKVSSSRVITRFQSRQSAVTDKVAGVTRPVIPAAGALAPPVMPSPSKKEVR